MTTEASVPGGPSSPPVDPVAGPTVVRRQLGRRLRQLRENASIRSGEHESPEQVSAHRELGISRAKLYRLEGGQHSAKPQDVAALCRHYRASDEETDALVALALATQEDGWWHAFGDIAVPEWFSLYVDLEPAASAIRSYESELIPGLLQTRDYAETIYRVHNPTFSDDQIAQRAALRLRRQTLLDRVAPPTLHVVLSETAVRRTVGNPAIMATQVERLRRLAERPNITIEIIPFSAGAHAGMEGSFVILDFPDPTDGPSVVYLETAVSAVYLQKTEDLVKYNEIFTRTQAAATPIEEFTV
ncbi:helix-turn-helix transcriptional regulator [Pilimelia columellifera]|uniref:Helix-turn-helix transcriptional regulator n=1 Tax=Pilimelia columellifera subsp. columellifera TaxID=706583 RepID=A0ABP6AH23_9ACTN